MDDAIADRRATRIAVGRIGEDEHSRSAGGQSRGAGDRCADGRSGASVGDDYRRGRSGQCQCIRSADGVAGGIEHQRLDVDCGAERHCSARCAEKRRTALPGAVGGAAGVGPVSGGRVPVPVAAGDGAGARGGGAVPVLRRAEIGNHQIHLARGGVDRFIETSQAADGAKAVVRERAAVSEKGVSAKTPSRKLRVTKRLPPRKEVTIGDVD